MISAELTYTVESLIRESIETTTSYKRRPDGSFRLYSGVNALKFGDMWQFPPVSGVVVFTPPRTFMRGHVLIALDMYWNREFQLLELLTQVRCMKDLWFQGVLKELREGRMSEDTYNFLHGDSTERTGSWRPDLERSAC